MQFNSLMVMFILVPILSLVLLGLNLLLAPHTPYAEKQSPYESGFLPIEGQTRETFNIQWYIVSVLFLIFDLELLLLFPLAFTLYQVNLYGFVIAMIFFIILTVGFVVEFNSGAIKIESKQESKDDYDELSPHIWVIALTPYVQLIIIAKN